MKKSLLAVLLVLTLSLLLLPVTQAADSDFVIENGVLKEYTGSGGDVTIPEGVTSVDWHVFRDCTSLIRVTIPEGVTSIGGYAFQGCTSLTRVTIPEGVTSIGYHAFYGCTSLTDVAISTSVTEISPTAFERTPWQDSLGDFIIANGVLFAYKGPGGAVTIPEGVTSIGDSAFASCSSLTSVVIPEGVTSVGCNAFFGCTGLTHIVIPGSVISIGEYGSWTSYREVFSGCTGLKTAGPIGGDYNIEFGWTQSIPGGAFYSCHSLTSLVIPDGVTTIGDSAFSSCSSLTSVTLPNGLTSIGEGAFKGCTSLTSVVLPEGVTSVGHEAFRDCASLTSVIIPESATNFATVKNLTWFVGYAFKGCPELKTAGPVGGDYNIQFGWAETIPQDAFYCCDSLTSVTIPNGVTTIGKSAFEDCVSLTSATIPDTVTAIGQWAFADTPWLKSQGEFAVVNGILLEYQGPGGAVVVPEGVTGIGPNAFYCCDSLTSVTIPEGVTSIGFDAFSHCTGLTSATIPDSVTTIDNFAFFGCTSLTIHGGGFSEAERYCKEHKIPFAYTDHKFRIDENGVLREYRGPGGDVVIPAGVTSIGDSAFSSCSSLTSVTIPEGVTSIGWYAFSGCTGLTHIVIPASVTSIESGAFVGTPWLKSQGEFAVVNGILLEYQGPGGDVVIPAGVTSIGDSAFSSCSSLTGVTIPEGVTSIGASAFYYCAGLTRTTIPDSVASIGEAAFAGCDDLTRVTIPASVTSIGEYAFAGLEDGFYVRDDLTVYGKAGSYAQQYCAENGIPFVDGNAPATAQAGTLTSASGEAVEWSITEAGEISVDTASLAPEEKVLVGCYDHDGQFIGVKWLTAQSGSVQIDPSTPNVKLFWLGEDQAPLSESATVWGK